MQKGRIDIRRPAALPFHNSLQTGRGIGDVLRIAGQADVIELNAKAQDNGHSREPISFAPRKPS